MTTRTSAWPAGVPCWTDLQSPDVSVASSYYAAVMGWDVAEPDEQYGGYVIAAVDGAAVAGIGPQQAPGPSAWTLYISSDDADATQQAVTDHGGAVLLPTGDVGPLGRMAIVADPTGAVFGVWQAGAHIGAARVNEPGSLTWEDLRSTDPDRARAFYTGVFGYRTDPLDMASPDYTTFSLADREAPLGGMGGMMGAPEGAPSHWLVYFAVADAQAAVAASAHHGGDVLAEPFATPFGHMAALTDPFGAVFWIVESDGSNQPEWPE